MPKPIDRSFLERDDVLSWGRVVREKQYVAHPNFRDELPRLIAAPERESKLATGLRRSYGDSCLNGAGAVIDVTGLDRFMAFDPQTGRLRAEAGVSLSAVLQLVVPHGWFLPTTPGTRFVTLGGAVANDVHGKNHHRAGAFGAHVVAIGLIRSDGRRLVLEPDNEPDLFRATIAGLGLTGVIEWVELQLTPIRSAYLDVEILPYENLDAFWRVAEESVQLSEHTVSWVDCMTRGAHEGRGVFTRANWADDRRFDAHSDRTFKNLPVEFPGFALNRLTVGAFNEAYYDLHRMKKKKDPPTLFDLFLSARQYPELEQALWLGRHDAVSMRRSVRDRERRHASASRRDIQIGTGVVPRRPEDLRRPAIPGHAFISAAGSHAYPGFSVSGRCDARADEPARRNRA